MWIPPGDTYLAEDGSLTPLKTVDVTNWTQCDEVFEGKPKLRCSMVKDHECPHKRITRTGRVTHSWPRMANPLPKGSK